MNLSFVPSKTQISYDLRDVVAHLLSFELSLNRCVMYEPVGRGSAGGVTNSQPKSSRSSISKQSVVSTRAVSNETLRETAAGGGPDTRTSRSPPVQSNII